eukprot:3530067-Heterocapsa_arctica.AAC.1
MFRGGYRLPRLRKVLRGHRLRCNSLRPGDILFRLDASSWAFRMADERTWISSTTSVKIHSILDPQTGKILVCDANGQYGDLEIDSFLFEIEGVQWEEQYTAR